MRRLRLRAAALIPFALLAACLEHPEVRPLPEGAREAVVLVHGMGRSPLSMAPLQHDFEEAGYRVLNWGYSSWCCDVAELAQRLAQDLDGWRGDAQRIHFVGHSLGNIIVRQLLAERDSLPVGRIVMLAPPNQGSSDADRWAEWLGGVLRPIADLRTDSVGTVRQLPTLIDIEVAIIAGEDDGKVSVAETRLAGADAHIVVPAAHSFIMMRSDSRQLALGFIRDGSF